MRDFEAMAIIDTAKIVNFEEKSYLLLGISEIMPKFVALLAQWLQPPTQRQDIIGKCFSFL